MTIEINLMHGIWLNKGFYRSRVYVEFTEMFKDGLATNAIIRWIKGLMTYKFSLIL